MILPEPITIRIPIVPPSANGMHRNVPGKGRSKTAAYQKWCDQMGLLVNGQRRVCVDVPYRIEIAVERHQRSKRARDIDNCAKPLSDLLVRQGGLKDDSLAEHLTIYWSDDIEGCEIKIKPAIGDAA